MVQLFTQLDIGEYVMNNKILYIKTLKGQYVNIDKIECLWVKESFMLDGTYNIMIDIAGRDESYWLVEHIKNKETAQTLLDVIINVIMDVQEHSSYLIIDLETIINAEKINPFQDEEEN